MCISAVPVLGLLSPISEPCPGLGDRNEYMRQGPLRPPLPPYPSGGSIDLHPQVPVYEVRDKKLMCVSLREREREMYN